MKVTVVQAYKTKKAAERLAADYNRFDSDLHFRVIKADAIYIVIRDYVTGDDKHGLDTMEVAA